MDAQRREQLLNDLAHRIERAGMTAPAILFLETYQPLAFLGAQLLWFAQPFLTLGLNENDVRDLTLLLEERAGVADLIARLETLQSHHAATR
jgi:hypothetical protein